MLLLLLSCTDVSEPPLPEPTIVGLSSAAPEPVAVLSGRFTFALPSPAGTHTLLDVRGRLHAWSPPAAPTVLYDGPPVVDLTHSRTGLVGLSQAGTVIMPPAQILSVDSTGSGEGLLTADQDTGLLAVLQDGLSIIDVASQTTLWHTEANASSAIEIGGGQVVQLDTTNQELTAWGARSGTVNAQRTIRPPRTRSKSGKAPRDLDAPRPHAERRDALYYDPTTDRLFFRQQIFDGRTLETLNRIPTIDGVLHADQSGIIAYRQGLDGTISLLRIDPVDLQPEGRVPLLRPEGSVHISYDPVSLQLTLSEPGRDRVLLWRAPLTRP